LSVLSRHGLIIMLILSFFVHTLWMDSRESSDLIPYAVNESSHYTNHDPIRIHGNAGFTSGAYPGSGTENNPYVIENYKIIAGCDDPAIEIRDTDVYFVIRNCRVSMDFGMAVMFYDVVNGYIDSCEITGGSIEFHNSNHCEIVDCTIEQFECETISILFSVDCVISENTIQHCQTGIFLLGTNDSLVHNNFLNENSVATFLLLKITWLKMVYA
jgi:parallel beta-helix repeat protein